jgi:hypothetical protein
MSNSVPLLIVSLMVSCSFIADVKAQQSTVKDAMLGCLKQTATYPNILFTKEATVGDASLIAVVMDCQGATAKTLFDVSRVYSREEGPKKFETGEVRITRYFGRDPRSDHNSSQCWRVIEKADKSPADDYFCDLIIDTNSLIVNAW